MKDARYEKLHSNNCSSPLRSLGKLRVTDTVRGCSKQRLGAVTTVLTFTSPGSSSSETGCVGAGAGGAVITGSTVCPSANNVFSTATGGFTNFNNFQFVFNASEPGSATDITLT